MNTPPRAVYPISNVEQMDACQQIVKYMSWKKFVDLVTMSSLYFRRIDEFSDTFEGTIPLAVWDLKIQAIQDWYNRCKKEIFVNCWNLDDVETPMMWREYAEGHGVRISSTVGLLTAEMSNPQVPPLQPYDPAIVKWAKDAGAVLAEVDLPPQDGFTLGKIKYLDWENIDIHEILKEGTSNTVPAFRKRDGFVNEREFRAILRPASVSGDAAVQRGDVFLWVPVRLETLIQEIRFAPVNDAKLEQDIRDILADNRLNVSAL